MLLRILALINPIKEIVPNPHQLSPLRPRTTWRRGDVGAFVWTFSIDFSQSLGMFRGVAIVLVAMAAFDLYFLDGRYIHAFQEIGRSILHHFAWY
jgi:hypothetical protein